MVLWKIFGGTVWRITQVWLKGLAWKVSRSLIAAQGFKSLILRCESSCFADFLIFCVVSFGNILTVFANTSINKSNDV